jgi:hypothetical protein
VCVVALRTVAPLGTSYCTPLTNTGIVFAITSQSYVALDSHFLSSFVRTKKIDDMNAIPGGGGLTAVAPATGVAVLRLTLEMVMVRHPVVVGAKRFNCAAAVTLRGAPRGVWVTTRVTARTPNIRGEIAQ